MNAHLSLNLWVVLKQQWKHTTKMDWNRFHHILHTSLAKGQVDKKVLVLAELSPAISQNKEFIMIFSVLSIKKSPGLGVHFSSTKVIMDLNMQEWNLSTIFVLVLDFDQSPCAIKLLVYPNVGPKGVGYSENTRSADTPSLSHPHYHHHSHVAVLKAVSSTLHVSTPWSYDKILTSLSTQWPIANQLC